jgi:hypothetical protein
MKLHLSPGTRWQLRLCILYASIGGLLIGGSKGELVRVKFREKITLADLLIAHWDVLFGVVIIFFAYRLLRRTIRECLGDGSIQLERKTPY